jgi:group I intron endonuclease
VWIYKLTNTITGKVYVGKTVDLEARLYRHSRAYDTEACSIHRAIKKYGWSAFRVDVLESGITTNERLSELERHWISELCAMDRSVGYNLTAGGEGLSCYKHSAETGLAGLSCAKERRLLWWLWRR